MLIKQCCRTVANIATLHCQPIMMAIRHAIVHRHVRYEMPIMAWRCGRRYNQFSNVGSVTVETKDWKHTGVMHQWMPAVLCATVTFETRIPLDGSRSATVS